MSGFADALSVGHRPPQSLTPQDETLFRAFQSNLLSLISHELRTPLMGVLNALNLLEEGVDSAGISAAELTSMARSNAQRLHRTLAALLDLAALDSGTFHVRLREVDLKRLATGRVDAHRSALRERSITLQEESERAGAPVLADPQKLGRALDLALQALVPRVRAGSEIKLRISSSRLSLQFQLTEGAETLWQTAWTQALAGHQGGVTSPTSAFAGVMQSEQAFLTRMEEGLGSEFLLIHEIMRLHHGKFTSEMLRDSKVELVIEVPTLSSEAALKAVLESRAYEVSTELASVALVLLLVPQGKEVEDFAAEVRRSLFRTSDAVYVLPGRREIALVLDDCKPEDAPRMVERIGQKLKDGELVFGAAQCPADGLDPALLLEIAERRLKTRGL